MKRIALIALIVCACALFVAACGDDDSGNGSSTTNSTTGAADTGKTALPQGSDPVELDPADFTTNIDNQYWPMQPGNRWVSRSEEERVVVEVTDQKKDVSGIEAVVVRDTVTDNNGNLVEKTDDWYAQDSDGNLWYLGENVRNYRDGKLTDRGGSWEHGVNGAYAGIAIPADPQPGQKYRQEYYKGEAEDQGKVLSVTETVKVPAGTFRDALKTSDTTPLEPDVEEQKSYAKGVGPVKNETVRGGSGTEELVSYTVK
jgi:hypothetical protein